MISTPVPFPTFTVAQSASRLEVQFDRLPLELRARLAPVIADLTAELLALVRGAEPYRTGRLRRNTRSFVDQGPDFIRGRVRVIGGARDLAAAGALEYGAHRAVNVRGYERRGVMVRAYQRRADIRQRRFMRGSSEALRGHAVAKIDAAIAAAAAEQGL